MGMGIELVSAPPRSLVISRDDLKRIKAWIAKPDHADAVTVAS